MIWILQIIFKLPRICIHEWFCSFSKHITFRPDMSYNPTMMTDMNKSRIIRTVLLCLRTTLLCVRTSSVRTQSVGVQTLQNRITKIGRNIPLRFYLFNHLCIFWIFYFNCCGTPLCCWNKFSLVDLCWFLVSKTLLVMYWFLNISYIFKISWCLNSRFWKFP